MLKIVKRKIGEEQNVSKRMKLLGYLGLKEKMKISTPDEHDGPFSPTLKTRIQEELDDRESISSAVFDNMMTNHKIRQDVLRELTEAI